MGQDDQCSEGQLPASDACIDFCTQWVLPGCDCFGCCTFTIEDEPVPLVLESGFGCTPESLEGCQSCTSRIEECGNVCGECERCIGDTAPPDACRTQTCDGGSASTCTTSDDCACGEMCLLGCCYPLPPG